MEDFSLKLKEINQEIAEVFKKKSQLFLEQYPYIGKWIELESDRILVYIKVNKLWIDRDDYCNFEGDIIDIKLKSFKVSNNSVFSIHENELIRCSVKEVSEEEFNKCISNLPNIINPVDQKLF